MNIHKLTYCASIAGMLFACLAIYLHDLNPNEFCGCMVFFVLTGCFSVVKGVEHG